MLLCKFDYILLRNKARFSTIVYAGLPVLHKTVVSAENIKETLSRKKCVKKAY
jgi:hypothetical protein